MKKLLIGLIVCSMASGVFAAPGFSFEPAGPIQLTPGVPVTVNLMESGSAAISGATLYLGTTPFDFADPGDPFTANGPIVITALEIGNDAAGTIFAGNGNPATVSGGWNGFPPVLAFADLTTQNGFSSTTGLGVVARVTIMAKLGSEGTLGQLSTSTFAADSVLLTSGGADLGFAQASAALMVIPEPVSGLLLLAGLPLLRRRRA